MPEPSQGPANYRPPRPPYRKIALYTAELTPRFELPEELRVVLDPILDDEPYKGVSLEDAYPWFFHLEEGDRIAFLEYCEELDCLHEDLEFVLFDLETALDFSYPEEPYFQRLALIYHTDNVDLRVHAYREKVFKLIDCFLGRDGDRRDTPGGEFHKKVLDALSHQGLGRVVGLLNRLARDFTISASVERRNLFVHGLAPRDWRLLKVSRGIDEQISEPSGVMELEQYANLALLQQQRREEIGAICERLAQFRYNLVTELKRAGTPQ